MIIFRQWSGPDGGEIELSFLISWPNIETNVDKLTKRMRYFFRAPALFRIGAPPYLSQHGPTTSHHIRLRLGQCGPNST